MSTSRPWQRNSKYLRLSGFTRNSFPVLNGILRSVDLRLQMRTKNVERINDLCQVKTGLSICVLSASQVTIADLDDKIFSMLYSFPRA